MIKIEINAENGADARKELIDLLGLSANPVTTVKGSDLKIELGNPATATLQYVTERPQAEEQTEQTLEPEKKKRRTKAEIEAETSKVNTGSEEPPATEVKQETTDKVPELKDLQRVCAILVRAGYKQNGIDFIKNVGGAESSVEVPEGKRQAVIDAMTAFAEENKIAL